MRRVSLESLSRSWNLSKDQLSEPKRYSFTVVEASKHSNSDTSGTYTPQTAASRRNRTHVYEDVERTSRPHTRHAYEDVDAAADREPTSRTSSWVSKHTEMGWGQSGVPERELTGSLWAHRNRSHKEKRDHRRARRFSIDSYSPQSQPEREADLTTTYCESSSKPSDHRSVNIPVNYSTPGRASGTLPVSSAGVQRRVSYLTALQSNEKRPVERRSEQSVGDPSQFTSHRYSHSSAHKHLRPRDPSSLPLSSTPPTLVHRHNSETPRVREDGYNQFQDSSSLSFQSRLKPVYPHRTLNTGRPSPRGSGLQRTSSAQQVEPFLKQSLL